MERATVRTSARHALGRARTPLILIGAVVASGCCFGGAGAGGNGESGELFSLVMQRRGFAAATWTVAVDATLAQTFCGDGTFFRTCFAVDRAECEQRAHRLFRTCVEENIDAIPQQPDAQSGRQAGELLGACAGSRYEIELSAEGRAQPAPFCDEPSHWM